ncbi:DoxX-like protein [Alteromonadaceae bacterium 2753L.S.0a.02]|nr:DoxX-like protein [Alteromonadaceae bacterium 2753L.S.0a.02]
MNFLKRYYLTMLSIWIAFVFVQSLFFKFSNSHETQHIFGTLGAWAGLPWFAAIGGYLIGTLELCSAVLLFTPLRPWGALLAFEIMSGAIVFHLFTPLGIVMPTFDSSGAVVGDDGGALFIMACLVWASATIIVLKDWLSSRSVLRFWDQKPQG